MKGNVVPTLGDGQGSHLKRSDLRYIYLEMALVRLANGSAMAHEGERWQ